MANTLKNRLGSSDEFAAALEDLLSRGLIELATHRDKGSLRWIPLSAEQSVLVLKDLKASLRQSVGDNSWHLSGKIANSQALLTDAGLIMARTVLAEDGWPQEDR